MGGKALAAIGGVLSLVAVFALTWIDSSQIGGILIYGMGGIVNNLFGSIAEYFTNAALVSSAYNAVLGTTGDWIAYVMGVVIILIIASGVLSLIGIKVRFLAFLGGLFALLPGLLILLATFLDGVEIITNLAGMVSVMFMSNQPLVENIIPFNFAIGGRTEAIGSYVLILGGLLAIISSFISRDDY
jgi:hypothetical protein